MKTTPCTLAVPSLIVKMEQYDEDFDDEDDEEFEYECMEFVLNAVNNAKDCKYK